jgi:MFS family permease
MYVYFVPVFAQTFGASFFDLGIIGSSVALTSALTPIFVGYLADELNRAWLFSLALVINALASFVLILSRSIMDIVLLRLIGGLGLGFYYVTVEVLVTDLAPLNKRVNAIAWYSAATTAGLLLGAVVGGLIIQEMGFMELFVLSSIVIAIGVIQAIWISPGYTRGEQVAFDFSGSVRTIRRLLPWYMMIALYGIVISVLTSIFPGYANSVGVSASLIGLLFAAFGVTRIFVYMASPRYVEFGERRALFIASLFVVIGFLGLGISHSFGWFLAAIMLIGGCSGMVFPITISLISRHFPDEKLGAAVGSYETSVSIGQAVGPFLAGTIASLANVQFSLLLMAIFGLLMAGFTFTGQTWSLNFGRRR